MKKGKIEYNHFATPNELLSLDTKHQWLLTSQKSERQKGFVNFLMNEHWGSPLPRWLPMILLSIQIPV